jgi:hypothetical protein
LSNPDSLQRLRDKCLNVALNKIALLELNIIIIIGLNSKVQAQTQANVNLGPFESYYSPFRHHLDHYDIKGVF